jgi:hypothetical protein
MLIYLALVLFCVVFRGQSVAVGQALLTPLVSGDGTAYLAVVNLPKVDTGETSAVVAPTARLNFVRPGYLDQEQLDNIDLVKKVITDPASVEKVSDKAPITELDHNAIEVYLSLLEYESNYRHVDESGNVKYSYTGCCVGIAQVSLATGVCETWELFVLERNIWCGAKIFANYYTTWAPKAGDDAFKITVAMYKNAVVMKEDLSDFLPGPDGLPIVPPDDPNDPMDFASQIATVFIHPSTGEARFVFTTE